MEDNLNDLLSEVCKSELNIVHEGDKTVFELGKNAKYGIMETYAVFPGIVLAFIDIKIDNPSDVFFESINEGRLLEINHCLEGRYAYSIDEDNVVYFGKGDLCASIYNLSKNISDFPIGYYKGLELFVDVDIANDYIKEHIPNFDLIDFYENLENNEGYVLIRANEQINHIIGELYKLNEKIKLPYFKIKTIELLLFFSITKFNDIYKSISLKNVKIVDNVKNDLMNDLDSKITLGELANKYNISKTTLKNSFKEVYGKPIFKWRKEYKLDYASKLIRDSTLNISEISKKVGYSSPSKFSQVFKEYKGCTPLEYRKF